MRVAPDCASCILSVLLAVACLGQSKEYNCGLLELLELAALPLHESAQLPVLACA